MHIVQEVNSQTIARCRFRKGNQVAMLLTEHGYKPVLPRQAGNAFYVYPGPIAAPFNGSALIEPFYAEEKRYLAEISAAFEAEHGVPPEQTWYLLFWDREYKISGINIVASGRVSLLDPLP